MADGGRLSPSASLLRAPYGANKHDLTNNVKTCKKFNESAQTINFTFFSVDEFPYPDRYR